MEGDMAAGEEYDSDSKERMRELISKKLKKEKGSEKAAEAGGEDEERGRKTSRRYERRSLFLCECRDSFGAEGQIFFRPQTGLMSVSEVGV